MINHYLGNQIYSKCKEEPLIFSQEQTKMVEMHLKRFSEEEILKEIFPNSTDKEIEDNVEFNEYKHSLKIGNIYNFLSEKLELKKEDITICNDYFEETRQYYEK